MIDSKHMWCRWLEPFSKKRKRWLEPIDSFEVVYFGGPDNQLTTNSLSSFSLILHGQLHFTIWSVWLTWNKFIFKKNDIRMQQIVYSTIQHAIEFFYCAYRSNLFLVKTLCCTSWISRFSHPLGYIKLNTNEVMIALRIIMAFQGCKVSLKTIFKVTG